jgi:hypothetical protein
MGPHQPCCCTAATGWLQQPAVCVQAMCTCCVAGVKHPATQGTLGVGLCVDQLSNESKTLALPGSLFTLRHATSKNRVESMQAL